MKSLMSIFLSIFMHLSALALIESSNKKNEKSIFFLILILTLTDIYLYVRSFLIKEEKGCVVRFLQIIQLIIYLLLLLMGYAIGHMFDDGWLE